MENVELENIETEAIESTDSPGAPISTEAPTIEQNQLNKHLDININKFKTLDDALAATDAKFIELNPEPVRSEEKRKYKRSSIINLGEPEARASLWVTVEPNLQEPLIYVNHSSPTGSNSIELAEIDALMSELRSAKTKYLTAKQDAEARQIFDAKLTAWKKALDDCRNEVISQWRKAHPQEIEESED